MYKRAFYVIFILLPFLLIVLSIIYKSEPIVMSSRLLSVVYPVKSLYLLMTQKFTDISDFFSSHKRLIEENKQLKEEILRLKAKEEMLDFCQEENSVLKRFLDYKYENNYNLVLVRVVEYIRGYSKDLVVVDGGEGKGIKKGMYAITESGLAGKVVETTNSNSYIRLLSDRRSFFSVVTLKNQTRGIIQGQGRLNQSLNMKYIPMSANVEIEDIVVTAQSMETYSIPGIPIGVIKDVRQFSVEMFQEATVMPFVRFDHLDYLFIVVSN